MSKSLESQVWKSALSSELKPIAAVMADMGNDDGLGIYPSVAYLAWLLGRSERFIQSGLKKLCKLGVLDRVSNAAGGRGLTPRYRLSGDSLPERPTWSDSRKGEICAPFSKGAIYDQKGANGSEKGAQFAPDPSEKDSLQDTSGKSRAIPREKPLQAEADKTRKHPKIPAPLDLLTIFPDLRELIPGFNLDAHVKKWCHYYRSQPRNKLRTLDEWSESFQYWMADKIPNENGNGAVHEQSRFESASERNVRYIRESLAEEDNYQDPSLLLATGTKPR